MDAQKLAEENAALNEQIKLLVRTERRLYGAQRVIERQLQQFQALNRLALQAGRAAAPERILADALATLRELFDLDQGIALFADDRGALTTTAVEGLDGGGATLRRGWAPRASWPPSLHTPIVLDAARPATVLDGSAGVLLEELGRAFAADPGANRGGRAAIEVVLPLVHKDERLLGLLVLRKLDRAASYHQALVGQGDLPYLALVATHVEMALSNVTLYRQLRAFADHLEDKIAARTADLAHANRELARGMRRLQETQDKLIQAGKTAAVLTLVAGLSHELNNPLGVITGYAQMLLREVPQRSPWREPIAAIDRQARRCGQLVRALYEFARERPVAREPVAVEALVRGAAGRIAANAARRGVDVRLDAGAATERALLANAAELEGALLAVLANAVDASAAGMTVSVQARPQLRPDGDGVEISVRDGGSGIPADVLPRIFDPFFTTKQLGHGIGLPLARQTIESHGGRIDVQSAPGAGTTVRIWLPAPSSGARHEHAGDAP